MNAWLALALELTLLAPAAAADPPPAAGVSAPPATPITLEQVRQESSQSTSARQAELERLQATEQRRLARSAALPQVALGVQLGRTFAGTQSVLTEIPHFGAEGLTYEEGTMDLAGYTRGNYQFGVTLSQLLWDGGRWWTRIDQAGEQVEAAGGQQAEQVLAAEFEGVRRFYELLRAQQALAVLAESTRRSEEQLERARALFVAGRGSALDAITAEANLVADRRTVLQQRGRIAQAQAELTGWLGRPAQPGLQALPPPALDVAPPAGPDAEQALQQARRARPLLRAVRHRIEAARLGAQLAEGSRWPQLTADLSYTRPGQTLDPVFTDPSRQNVFAAGLNLRWELFTGYTSDIELQQALLQRRAAELELAQAERELEAGLQAQSTVLALQVEQAVLAASGVQVARRGLELAEQRFSAGAGSTIEVRDAQLKVAQAELADRESRIDVALAREALRRLIGGALQ